MAKRIIHFMEDLEVPLGRYEILEVGSVCRTKAELIFQAAVAIVAKDFDMAAWRNFVREVRASSMPDGDLAPALSRNQEGGGICLTVLGQKNRMNLRTVTEVDWHVDMAAELHLVTSAETLGLKVEGRRLLEQTRSRRRPKTDSI
ncbi:MAG TPA: hypothetical protein DCY48_00545 [Candidatus Magasanikbacteria bacterium]|nr:MAG: hypothetical protein A3I74_02555 [Candidatus Magasanikbacteria bacterium RIFCSPLOWO2_02_FULL_47_16]OGH79613.1 MAG: hypothetical protein A3C10_00845 [Candidatus Magasanikbacteria bacterium RIFCSPHIGHO2_02_FULL_48_18]OGH82029.1 MAG: hypothetical protein A3G08_02355 [Candidatus Magasanikbacteria bacterium RIFCSPLOWO2_12_FULL_47_9b]HAZ28252.1 hypothetical protein [Candidatus Magasanikbacteria bacterium]